MREPIPPYDVVIRTRNSSKTLPAVLDSLLVQEAPPSAIVVVDSGSSDSSREIARSRGCVLVEYRGFPFNYSRALNQGFASVQSPFCLVLSSHVVLLDRALSIRLLREVADPSTPAAYVDISRRDPTRTMIDLAAFDGWRGLWNPCAMYRTNIVRDMQFDEGVPTAEDLLFARRLYERGFRTVAISGDLVDYRNPFTNRRKIRNEYVARAFFVHPPLMSWRKVAAILKHGAACAIKGELSTAADRVILACRLVAARLRAPGFASDSYFTQRATSRAGNTAEGA